MTDPASPLAQMPASLAYPSSKSALNMITAVYARELRDTPIKVNAANPGYTATDLNRHSGFRSAAEGAEASVYLATLGPDGPSGILWGHLWTAGGPGRRLRPAPLVTARGGRLVRPPISITIRALRSCRNAMKPRFQRVLTPWKPGSMPFRHRAGRPSRTKQAKWH